MAFAGMGVIAAGAFATMAVGMGSDMIVMKSTIADTQLLSKTLKSLEQATLFYGASSGQAQYYTKLLNVQMQMLGNTAGVQAELGLAKLAATINSQWDQATSEARVQAVALLTQVLLLGQRYIPLVAEAARENLTIINQGLIPLFAWLKGPQGVGIFLDLENKFKKDLPTSVHAFSQAIEFLLRFLDLASNYAGGLVQGLDRLFTYLNSSAGFARVKKDVADVVAVFRIWKEFIKLLAQDLFLLLGQTVGVGNTIIQMLTGMLFRLHGWLQSTSGRNAIGSLFEAHKKEIVAILDLLPKLAPALSIYLALAVPLTIIAADVIQLLNFMLSIPTVGPAIAWGLALIIIVNQLKLIALFTGLAGLIRGIGLAIALAGAAASGNAPAFGRLAAALFGVDAAAAEMALPFIMIGLLVVATGVLIYLLITRWKELSSTVGGIMSLMGTMFHNAIGQWGGAFNELGMIVQAIGHKFTTAFAQWGAAFSLLGTAIRLILGNISTEFTTAFAQWGAAFSMVGTAFKLEGDKIVTAFSSMLTSLEAKFKVSTWWSIGQNIVTGVVDGIESYVSWASGKIAGFFTALYNAAKAALESGSPSRIYSGLGASIPQGVGVGIAQNTSSALVALSSMFKQMNSQGSRMARTGGGGPALALAGGHGAISLHAPISITMPAGSQGNPQAIATAVQKALDREFDHLITRLQGGVYSTPGT